MRRLLLKTLMVMLVLNSPLGMAQTPISVNVIYPEQTQANQTFVLTGTVEAKQYA
jgi:hypothetical protein